MNEASYYTYLISWSRSMKSEFKSLDNASECINLLCLIEQLCQLQLMELSQDED